MPEMVDTYNKYKGRGLEFVAVAMKYDPANYSISPKRASCRSRWRSHVTGGGGQWPMAT